MFKYFGSKWRLAPKYPAPLYKRIIEPFAGGAGYSLRYYQHNVHLYEIDERIYSLWKYLINVSAAEIRALPIKIIWHVDELKGVCTEAKNLISKWITTAAARPQYEASCWYLEGLNSTSMWGPEIRERIAQQVELIRHWKVYNTSYETAPNNIATWFVDSPYSLASRDNRYPCNDIDYRKLAAWCRKRNGQTMVCENAGANWLPFEAFAQALTIRSPSNNNLSHEVLWTQ